MKHWVITLGFFFLLGCNTSSIEETHSSSSTSTNELSDGDDRSSGDAKGGSSKPGTTENKPSDQRRGDEKGEGLAGYFGDEAEVLSTVVSRSGTTLIIDSKGPAGSIIKQGSGELKVYIYALTKGAYVPLPGDPNDDKGAYQAYDASLLTSVDVSANGSFDASTAISEQVGKVIQLAVEVAPKGSSPRSEFREYIVENDSKAQMQGYVYGRANPNQNYVYNFFSSGTNTGNADITLTIGHGLASYLLFAMQQSYGTMENDAAGQLADEVCIGGGGSGVYTLDEACITSGAVTNSYLKNWLDETMLADTSVYFYSRMYVGYPPVGDAELRATVVVCDAFQPFKFDYHQLMSNPPGEVEKIVGILGGPSEYCP